jgi:hypothetical protein
MIKTLPASLRALWRRFRHKPANSAVSPERTLQIKSTYTPPKRNSNEKATTSIS